MSKQPQRRLGRGLSALLGAEPVEVSPLVGSGETSAESAEKATDRVDNGSGGGVVLVPVDRVEPSPFQPRHVIDDGGLEALAASIRRAGVMQPVIVRPRADARFELVAGERRWRAAMLAGLDRVPALVRELSDENAAEWALIENVQREDLNAMERAWALRRLSERFSLSHQEVADRVGLDRTTVTHQIRMTELEEEIATMISKGEISGGHGRALLVLSPGPRRVALARRAASEGLSVRALEALVRAEALTPKRGPTSGGAEPDPSRSAVLTDLERRLGQFLGTKVHIRSDRGGTRGQVVIDYYGLDHFEGMLTRIGFDRRE